MNALTAPLDPATYATDPAPIGDALWMEAALAATFAHLRATWDACCTCGAGGDSPCREGGRFVKRHDGRRA